jgi:ABC-type transport system involved in cytochrome c biogenesis permease component
MVSTSLVRREMRMAARNPASFRLRLGIGILAWFGLMAVVSDRNGSSSGLSQLNAIHGGIVLMILIIAPLMTAECISRERREGTLDLLFLTSLNARGIVRSKFTVQFLRMASLWLVCVPFAMIPVLAGGVGAPDFLMNIALESALLCIALASGMAASVRFTTKLGGILGAVIFACFGGLINCAILGFISLRFLPGGVGLSLENFFRITAAGFALCLNGAKIANIAPGYSKPMLISSLVDLLIVLALTFIALRIFERAIARQRENQGETARQRWVRQTFLTPLFWKGVLARRLRRRLNSNPLIWLEYRTAWRRSGRWTLTGIVVLVESFAITTAPGSHAYNHLQVIIGAALLIFLAISSAGSFSKEKESGAFELLLVAPMTERQLVSRRLRAVASYYMPVLLTFLIFQGLPTLFGVGRYYEPDDFEVAHIVSMSLSAITIPVAGLYWALRLKSFAAILACTLLFGLIGPLFFFDFLGTLLELGRFSNSSYPASVLVRSATNGMPVAQLTWMVHGGFILWFRTATIRRLGEREFSF